jgi:hypothetical protein
MQSLELSAEHRHASDVQDSNGSDKGNVIISVKRGSTAVLVSCVALPVPLYTLLLTTSALLFLPLCVPILTTTRPAVAKWNSSYLRQPVYKHRHHVDA